MRVAISTIANRWVKDSESVKSFLHDCIFTLGIGNTFHCDNSFNKYTLTPGSMVPMFTNKEAKALNKKMDLCFDVCRRLDLDIYELGLDIMQPNASTTDIPKPHITSVDELMIDVYRITLDMKSKQTISIDSPNEKIAQFLRQRYHRILNPLELALCRELRILVPVIFFSVHDEERGGEILKENMLP